jgi:hypothetical protein
MEYSDGMSPYITTGGYSGGYSGDFMNMECGDMIFGAMVVFVLVYLVYCAFGPAMFGSYAGGSSYNNYPYGYAYGNQYRRY